MGLKLSKFLCFELETGGFCIVYLFNYQPIFDLIFAGIVIGFFHLVLAVLGMILCVTELIELVKRSCNGDDDGDCKFDRKGNTKLH